ncbi:MAG TPA: TIM barrel protein [Jatrophihabitans sp.]|nr:TIM barrel protein [Jatrophihabitans sp.]
MISDELVLSHHSIRHANFPQRVRAAAAAGYAGIGLKLGEYERLRAAGHSDAELCEVLAARGQQVMAYEALRGWASSGPAREQYFAHLRTIEQMVAAFGPPRHVQVIGPYEGDVDAAAAGFAAVCDHFAGLGTRAAIEYLPQMSNIPDAASAWAIASAAGRDNGGLCVDAWHHFRSGEGFEALARIPAERVFDVQLDDGPLRPTHPDYYTDCTSYRVVPGAGEFDLVGFLRVLDDMGVVALIEVEVISVDLDRLRCDDAAQRMADGARAVLAAARQSR